MHKHGTFSYWKFGRAWEGFALPEIFSFFPNTFPGRALAAQRLVEAAHAHGAHVLVDDFHGSGIVPIDVHATGIDFLVSGVLKWLCGGQGLALLYCRKDLIPRMEPRVVGWFGTKDPFDFDRERLRLRDGSRCDSGRIRFRIPLTSTNE